MSQINCESCSNLRDASPDFVVNGVTESVAESLEMNTGFNADLEVLHTDCEDLNDANDCLVGMFPNELGAYENCDWKEALKDFIGNLYEVLKAIIAAICGLWLRLEVVSYQGIIKLYTTTTSQGTSGASTQTPPFNRATKSGNLPAGVLTAASDFKSVIVNNTLDVPILVNATFNCSIISDQMLSSCYIVVTRDGVHKGQTPFITPSTYDQQVQMEPFILQPGKSTTLSYYFGIGAANVHFISTFGGTGAIQCTLVPSNSSDPKVQQSYFIVQAQTIIGG